jgi:hypothetical protein
MALAPMTVCHAKYNGINKTTETSPPKQNAKGVD